MIFQVFNLQDFASIGLRLPHIQTYIAENPYYFDFTAPLFLYKNAAIPEEKNVEDKEASLFEIYKNNEVFCAEAQNGESCKKAPSL